MKNNACDGTSPHRGAVPEHVEVAAEEPVPSQEVYDKLVKMAKERHPGEKIVILGVTYSNHKWLCWYNSPDNSTRIVHHAHD